MPNIHHGSNEPMLLTLKHNARQSPQNILLALALTVSVAGLTTTAAAIADSHTTSQPALHTLGYESVMKGYKTLDGGERTTWKESNDTVGQIGGWRSYAKEAYEANQADAGLEESPESHVEGVGENQGPDVEKPATEMNAKLVDSTAGSAQGTDTSAMKENPQRHTVAPSDSRSSTMIYQSAMTDYRTYDDNPPGDWKAANDRVGEIGGWRTYAKQAYEAGKQKNKAEADLRKTQ